MQDITNDYVPMIDFSEFTGIREKRNITIGGVVETLESLKDVTGKELEDVFLKLNCWIQKATVPDPDTRFFFLKHEGTILKVEFTVKDDYYTTKRVS